LPECYARFRRPERCVVITSIVTFVSAPLVAEESLVCRLRDYDRTEHANVIDDCSGHGCVDCRCL